MPTKPTTELPKAIDDPTYRAAADRLAELESHAESLKREHAAALEDLNALHVPQPRPTVEDAAAALLAREKVRAEAADAAAVIHRRLDRIEFDRAVAQRAIDRHRVEAVAPARERFRDKAAPTIIRDLWKPAVRRVLAGLAEVAAARQALDDLTDALRAADLHDFNRFPDPTPPDRAGYRPGDAGELGAAVRAAIGHGLASAADPFAQAVKLS